MAYEDLLNLNSKIPKSEYFDLLIENCEEIIDQTTERPKAIVAKELGMSNSAFSTAYQILLAVRRTNRKVH